MASTAAQVAHVWRRLGFGGTRAELDAAEQQGVQATIADLLARPPTVPTAADPDPWQVATPYGGKTFGRFLELHAFGPSAPGSGVVSAAYNPLQERIAWILQGLLVVAVVDVVQTADMTDHVLLLRSSTHGSYKKLLADQSVRPGMAQYLTLTSNAKGHPNENYARELMELFSLGRVDPVTGTPNYDQSDVREIARALTGYRYNWSTGQVFFDPSQWDSGTKTFRGMSLGPAGLPEVIDALASHPSWSRFVPARFYKELTGLDADAGVLAQLGAAFGGSGDLHALVTAIAQRPEFLSDHAIRSKTRSPVELVVHAARILGWNGLAQDDSTSWYMTLLGQHPFQAPNVAGWYRGDQWLNTTNQLIWSDVANWMARSGLDWAGNATVVLPGVERLFTAATTATAATAALRHCGIEDASPSTVAALTAYAGSGPWTRGRAAGLLNLAFLSPEFLAG